jgi:hypothetical protein
MIVASAVLESERILASEPLSVVEARKKAEAAYLESLQKGFKKAKATADVVAEVRVVTVVCTEAQKKDNKLNSVTVQIAMQILEVEKGPIKKNEIVVVSRRVETPQELVAQGYIPGAKRTVDVLDGKSIYPNVGMSRDFPLAPSVKGHVALTWDKEARAYVPLAGWVTEPRPEGVPVEVGKAICIKE